MFGGGGSIWGLYVPMFECELNWFPFFTVQSDSEYKCTSHSLTGQRHKIFTLVLFVNLLSPGP
jgi:hypothetical protein